MFVNGNVNLKKTYHNNINLQIRDISIHMCGLRSAIFNQ